MSKGLAVVTGGSRGLGLAIARRLARSEYTVAIFARDSSVFEQILPTLSNQKQQSHIACACDVACPKQLQSAFQSLDTKTPLKLLVNAAGTNHDGLLARLNQAKMESMLKTNLQGTITSTSIAVKMMLRHRQGGSIINISSASAHRANAGQAIYSATKAGVEGFTRTIAKEVASKGIRVNSIAPGYIETDMTSHLALDQLMGGVPLARLGTCEDIAETVEYLEACNYITGQTIVVDGGLCL
eukprot:m.287433 g.287433  ORF g.287433 m.287433 type:complete len:241 (+) comp17788_c0_seq1:10961-11683(+)